MVKLSSQDTNPNGGGEFLGAGTYHFAVTGLKLDLENQYGPQIEVTLQALAGTVEDCADKEMKAWFNLTGKSAGRLWKLLVATDLCTQEQWEAATESGADLDFDENALLGQQFIAEVELYKGKARIGFKIYHVNDPAVAHVPKDTSLSGGGSGGAPKASAQGANGGDSFDAFS